jgi:hypothetical protein
MTSAPDNTRRPSVINWLVFGALAVVAVLFAGNRLIQQRSAQTAASIVRIHSEAEPIVRASLDLAAAVEHIENSVTTVLQSSGMPGDPEAARALAELRDARVALETIRRDMRGIALSPQLETLLDSVAADALTLVRLDETRRAAMRDYSRSLASLAQRVRRAGGNGIWVGDQNVARRSLTELATAVNAIRAAAVADGAAALDQPSDALTQAEQQLVATLARHRAELTVSPGVAWLELLREDLGRVRTQRQDDRTAAHRVPAAPRRDRRARAQRTR